MISPLGQRQVFQTANVEAVRQAQEVSEVIQREQAKKQAVDDRLLEDQASVRVIAKSENIQTSERQGGRGAQEEPQGKPAPKEEEKPGEEPAESADPHLNFLA
jgi:hypothetical protein